LPVFDAVLEQQRDPLGAAFAAVFAEPTISAAFAKEKGLFSNTFMAKVAKSLEKQLRAMNAPDALPKNIMSTVQNRINRHKAKLKSDAAL